MKRHPVCGGKKQYECLICDNNFSRKSVLMIESVHEGKKPQKSHKCHVCDYKTSHNGHLKIHVKTVHEGIKSHKCHVCDLW